MTISSEINKGTEITLNFPTKLSISTKKLGLLTKL